MNIEDIPNTEQLLLAIIDNMFEGVAIHELIYDQNNSPIDYRLKAVNLAFEKLTNFNKVEVEGKLSTEVFGVREAPYLDRYATVVKDGGLAKFEIYFAPMKKYFSIVAISPLSGIFVTIFDDVTPLRKQEKQLLDFEKGFEKLNDIVFATDKNGEFTYVNKAFTLIYGYALPELTNKTPRVLKSGRQPVEFYAHFWRTLLQGKPVSADIYNKTKSGQEVIVAASASPITSKEGDVLGFLAVQRDVTLERKATFLLKQKINEVDTMNKLMVSRELKMIELKEKIVALEKLQANKQGASEKTIEE